MFKKSEEIGMALIKCIDCGKEISDKALACPNCGCPVSAMTEGNANSDCVEAPVMLVDNNGNKHDANIKKKNSKKKKLIILSIVLCVIFFALAVLLIAYEKSHNNSDMPISNTQSEIKIDNEASSVSYVSHEFTSINNEDIIIVNFSFTNKLDDYQSLYDAVHFKAYQAGMEIDGYYLNSEEAENSWREVAKGKSLICAIAFRANDKEEVYVRISAIIDGCFDSSEYQELILFDNGNEKNNNFDTETIAICQNGNHQKGEWKLTKEATLVKVGVEELFCSLCGESLDSRGTECKKAKVDGKAFNFKDDEFIAWMNGWDKNFEVSTKELGMSDLSPSNTSYAVKLESTGSEGILILNHNEEDYISGIMAYFEEPVEATAFISYIAKYIEYDFSTDAAGDELIDNAMAYTVGDVTAMRIHLKSDFEVTLLSPFKYVGELLAGASLTKNDCLVYIEKNNEHIAKYNFNIQKYIQNEFGKGGVTYFFDDDGIDANVEDIGLMMTFRGVVLGKSTEDEVKKVYGSGEVLTFNKNTDVFYQTMLYYSEEDIKYLEDTEKVLLYNYNDSYQIALYVDNNGIIDFITYFDEIWY